MKATVMPQEQQISNIDALNTELERRITASEHLLKYSVEVLGDEHEEEFKTVQSWINECKSALKSPDPVSVALLGGTGAGKSTLVNALLGASVLPTSSISVCTSSITRVRYKAGAVYSAAIEIVPRETWAKQVQLAADDIAASKNGDAEDAKYMNVSVVPEDEAARIRAIYGEEQFENFLKDGNISGLSESPEVADAFTTGTILLEFDNTEDLKKGISRYLTSKESFWPIVRSCTIEGPFEAFNHGGELVDLPGLNDPNEAREELTKTFLETAKFVWVVFNMKRSLGKELTQVLESRDLLNRLMAGGRLSTLTFVGTHSDDVATTDPEVVGLEEDASNSEIAMKRNEQAEDELRTNLRQVARSIATSGEDSPESLAIVDSLVSSPAFMVSASNYLQLTGATKSRVPVIFDDKFETNIPPLGNHMKSLCIEAGPKANAYSIVTSIEEIVAELASVANHAQTQHAINRNAGKIAQSNLAEGVTAAEQQLKSDTSKIITKLRGSLQQAVSRFEEGSVIDKAAVGRVVEKTAANWSAMHWATLRATTSRGGRYTSSTKGEIDLIKQLSGPVILNTMQPWTDFFGKDLPALTDEASGSLRIVLGNYAKALEAFGSNNEDVKKLLDTLLPDLISDVTESVEAALAVAKKTVETGLNKRQQELHRITEDAIGNSMKNVFERAASERGTGMKIRMNQHLESGSRSAVNKACDLVQRGLALAAADAMKSVLDEVSPAAGKIDAKSARITSSLVEVAPNRKFATEEQMTKLTKAVNAARQIVAPAIRFDPGVLAKTPPKVKVEPVDQVLAATPSTLEPIFVDASNVARSPGSAPDIHKLEECRAALMLKFPGRNIVMIADASLSRLVETQSSGEDMKLLNAMIGDNRLTAVPAGTPGKADAYILKLATRTNGIVISNDSYREFYNDNQWLSQEGRLFGHAFIEGIGWEFSIRFPVRNRVIV